MSTEREKVHMRNRTLAAVPLVGVAIGASLAVGASPAGADTRSVRCPGEIQFYGSNEVLVVGTTWNLPAGKTCYIRAHQICANGEDHWSSYTGYKEAGIISAYGCTGSNPTVYGGYDSFYK